MYFNLFKKYLEQSKNKKELVTLIKSTFPKEECIYALHILNEWDDSLHILSSDINSMNCENLVQAHYALYEKYYNMYREFIKNLLNIKDLQKDILENIHFKPVLRMVEREAEKLMEKEAEEITTRRLLEELVKDNGLLNDLVQFVSSIPTTVESNEEILQMFEEFKRVKSLI